MTIARVLFVAAALVVLAGCTPATVETAATPTPTATPSPTLTQEPVPVPATITIASTALTLTAADGEVVDSYDYFEDPAEVIAGFTATFGFAPVIEQTATPYEGYPFTTYAWEGFVLRDSEQPSDGTYYVEYYASTSVRAVRGIVITTVDGISVGDDLAMIAAAHPDDVQTGTRKGGEPVLSVQLDVVVLPDYVDSSGSHAARFSTGVDGTPGGLVEHISGPLGGGPGI